LRRRRKKGWLHWLQETGMTLRSAVQCREQCTHAAKPEVKNKGEEEQEGERSKKISIIFGGIFGVPWRSLLTVIF
jgi:hypothetical protein